MSNPIVRMRTSGNKTGYVILRQLFVDAICGVEIPGRWFERLEEAGLIFFHKISESWQWHRKAIESLDDAQLFLIYTQIRHGTSNEFGTIFASA